MRLAKIIGRKSFVLDNPDKSYGIVSEINALYEQGWEEERQTVFGPSLHIQLFKIECIESEGADGGGG